MTEQKNKIIPTDINCLDIIKNDKFTADLRNEIKHIENEENKSVLGLSFSTFLSTFNIFQVALGTILGYSVNKLIQDISTETLHPIVKRLLPYNPIDKITLMGINLNTKKIISSTIYFTLVLLLLYFVFTRIFRSYVIEIVKDNKKNSLNNTKNNLYNILIQKESYEILRNIDNTMKQYTNDKRKKYIAQ